MNYTIDNLKDYGFDNNHIEVDIEITFGQEEDDYGRHHVAIRDFAVVVIRARGIEYDFDTLSFAHQERIREWVWKHIDKKHKDIMRESQDYFEEVYSG